MADIQTFEDNDDRAVDVSRISFATEFTMPRESCSVTTTRDQRVIAIDQEV